MLCQFYRAQVWLEARCRTLWVELPWPESSGMTVQEAFEIEQPHLMPVPGMFDGDVKSLRVFPAPAW